MIGKQTEGKPIIVLTLGVMPLVLVILGLLDYVFLAKEIVSVTILFSLGVIVSIYNLVKKQYLFINVLSILIAIGLTALFFYLVKFRCITNGREKRIRFGLLLGLLGNFRVNDFTIGINL